MSKPRSDNDFTRFYLTKVANGEGCGCAERIIDVHEFNRLAGRSRLRLPLIPRPSRAGFVRFLQKAGLTRRPTR
ncbi:MAG: hypothetical protein AB8B51_20735 [Sedimentitalea sp.]